jgi:hypothetical protein
MSYGDYIKQLTYLPFVKKANERSRPSYNLPSLIPSDQNSARDVDGTPWES